MLPRERAEGLLREVCALFDPPLQSEAFEERCRLGGLSIRLAGWSAQDAGGGGFHGSAAAVREDPSPRAAYELIERLCVHWAQHGSGARELPLRTR